MLFSFKGVDGGQFKAVVQAAKNHEAIGTWLLGSGTKGNPLQIRTKSDEIETGSRIQNPETRAFFIENCTKLGIDPEKNEHA